MKNWTLSKRIVANSAFFASITVVIAAIGLTSLHRTASSADKRLVQDAIPGINYCADFAKSAMQGHILALTANAAADQSARERLLAQMNESATFLLETQKRYSAAITAEEDRRNFTELQTLQDHYWAQRKLYIESLRAGKMSEADQLLNEKLEPAFLAYRDQLAAMLKWNQQVAAQVAGEISSGARAAFVQTLVISISGLFLAVVFATVIVRTINRTLRRVSGSLVESSGQVASAAGQVSSSAQSLASGASEQAASLEETTSSLEEMTSMTKRNTEGASTAKGLASETRAAAEQGNASVDEMRRAMEAIKASSGDIAKIIKTIDEIAFQTNILALNAAVEAARAGEAGAGFAVVAEEVRALAQRSAHSARETADKIEIAIRNGDEGAKISQKVAEALGVIVEKARSVDSLVAEIATASLEQRQGIEQISRAASQMDQITQANAGSAEESAAAAEELNAQAIAMRESVDELQRLVGGQTADVASVPRTNSPVAVQFAVRPAPKNGKTMPVSPVRLAATSRRPGQGAAVSEAHFIDA